MKLLDLYKTHNHGYAKVKDGNYCKHPIVVAFQFNEVMNFRRDNIIGDHVPCDQILSYLRRSDYVLCDKYGAIIDTPMDFEELPF